MMEELYKVYGFISPGSADIGFTVPVFERFDKLYVQNIQNEKILAFEEVQLDRVDCFQSNQDEYYRVGDAAIYCTKYENSRFIFGDKNFISRFLRQSVDDYIDQPHFYKSANKFCGLKTPEYYGCKSDRDYILRQLLSKLAPDFCQKYEFRIEVVSYNVEERHCCNLPTGDENYLILNYNLDSYDDLYKQFIKHAYKKHSRIKEETTIEEIINIDLNHTIFPSWFWSNKADYRNIRHHLATLIATNHCSETKIKTEADNSITYLHNLRSTDENDLLKIKGWYQSYNTNQLSLDSVSLVSYITTILTKYAQKDFYKK